MSKMNVESITTFLDGSQLVLSTRYSGDTSFMCTLYVSSLCGAGKNDLRVVSDQFEAPTCREAQDSAYSYARRLFPDLASTMKEPPYLIWPGPDFPIASDRPKRRFEQRH
jgi:hypothetical protein